MAKTLGCNLGNYTWRLRKGRINDWEDERQYYWCQTCAKIRDKPPRSGAQYGRP